MKMDHFAFLKGTLTHRRVFGPFTGRLTYHPRRGLLNLLQFCDLSHDVNPR